MISARSAKVFLDEREHLFRVAEETKKPIMMCSYTLPGDKATQLINNATSTFTNMPNCARTVCEMADYRSHREAFLKIPKIKTRDASRAETVRSALAKYDKVLCEYQAADILAPYGIDLGNGGLATNANEAVTLAKAIGAPVALKIQSPDIPHKTEAGGIALKVEGENQIKAAFENIRANAIEYDPEADIKGILVRPMAEDGIEMIVGINNDSDFGPMLLVGLGGIFVEVIKEFILLPTPLSKGEAKSALDRLKGAALLGDVRGQKVADKDALADLIGSVNLQPKTAAVTELDESGDRPLYRPERGRRTNYPAHKGTKYAGNFYLVPLSDVLGAEVRGLDITEDLDDRPIKALESMGRTPSSLFRNPELSPEKQVKSHRLGKLSSHTQADYAIPEYPEIFTSHQMLIERYAHRCHTSTHVAFRRPHGRDTPAGTLSYGVDIPMKAAILVCFDRVL